jgi:thioredoxin reductase (NADPH)
MLDVLVIGGGISGGSAAIYTAQGGLRTAVIDSGKSQVKQVSQLYNYPGIIEISGTALMDTIKHQAIASGAEWTEGVVESVTQIDRVFSILLADGKELAAKHLIIATNLQTTLLEGLGFELAVNEKVPSGKLKKYWELSLTVQPLSQTFISPACLPVFQANLSSLRVMARQ